MLTDKNISNTGEDNERACTKGIFVIPVCFLGRIKSLSVAKIT